jgi:transposase
MKRHLKDTESAFAEQLFYVGIDVHQKQWTISIRNNQTAIGKTLSVEPSAEKLSNYLRRSYPGGNFSAVYEAGYSGFWPARELRTFQIPCMVVNPADIPAKQKELANKTDKVDSRKLARSLENQELKGIYIPDRSAEECRMLNRYRSRLVQEETRLKNRIKAMLAEFNYRPPVDLEGKRWSGAYLAWLASVRFETQYAQMAYDEQLSQLAETRGRQSRVVRQLKVMAKQDRSVGNQIQLLQTVPGIGFLTAILLVTELIDISRFRRLEELASFIGLVPSVHESDERSYSRGLSNRRHNELRSRLIESAWIAVRKDPVLTMKYGQLCKRMHRNKAIIRIAKVLVNRIRFVWKNQTPYTYGVVE